MTPEQVKAARAVLGWSAQKAADRAEIGGGKAHISKIELGHYTAREETLQRLRAAFEAAGVSFADDGKSICWK